MVFSTSKEDMAIRAWGAPSAPRSTYLVYNLSTFTPLWSPRSIDIHKYVSSDGRAVRVIRRFLMCHSIKNSGHVGLCVLSRCLMPSPGDILEFSRVSGWVFSITRSALGATSRSATALSARTKFMRTCHATCCVLRAPLRSLTLTHSLTHAWPVALRPTD